MGSESLFSILQFDCKTFMEHFQAYVEQRTSSDLNNNDNHLLYITYILIFTNIEMNLCVLRSLSEMCPINSRQAGQFTAAIEAYELRFNNIFGNL